MSNTANSVSGVTAISTTGTPDACSTTPEPYTAAPKGVRGVNLTDEQQRLWSMTMRHFYWCAPGAQHLFYSLLTHNQKHDIAPYAAIFDPTLDAVAATDGLNILINPDRFFDEKQYKLANRTFIVGHEVFHVARGDVEWLRMCTELDKVPMRDGGWLPFDNGLMQKAMDLCVNSLILESKIGECPQEAIDLGYADPSGVSVNSMSALPDVYRQVYEDDDGKGRGKNPGNQPGTAKGQIGKVLPPGQSAGVAPNSPKAQRNQQQWAIQIAVAKQITEKSMGKLPAGLQRLFDEILEPKIPWHQKIETKIRRVIGSGGLNWAKPNKRYAEFEDLYMPSPTGFGSEWIVILGDTSGSMGTAEFSAALSETAGVIQECRPRRCTMIWIDAAVQRIDEVEDLRDLEDVKERGAPGGGGTDFADAFAWVRKQDKVPDVMICFTDGHAEPFGKEPSFPVIWACTTDKDFPWGDVVRVEL